MYSVNRSRDISAQEKFLFDGIVVRPLQDKLYFFLSRCLPGKAENISLDFKLAQDYALSFQKMQNVHFSLEAVLSNPKANAEKKRNAVLKGIGLSSLALLVAVVATSVLGLVLGAGPLLYLFAPWIGIPFGLICHFKISELESFYKSIDESSLRKKLNKSLEFFKKHLFPGDSIERLKALGQVLKTHAIQQDSSLVPSASEQVKNLARDLETIGCRILHAKLNHVSE